MSTIDAFLEIQNLFFNICPFWNIMIECLLKAEVKNYIYCYVKICTNQYWSCLGISISEKSLGEENYYCQWCRGLSKHSKLQYNFSCRLFLIETETEIRIRIKSKLWQYLTHIYTTWFFVCILSYLILVI